MVENLAKAANKIMPYLRKMEDCGVAGSGSVTRIPGSDLGVKKTL
jgi:hypothetical protein